MATGLLAAELAATCNALGYFDGQRYQLEPHCKETVKDLIRYLRRDEDTHEIRRYLGNAKLVQTDLIPIIQTCQKDVELFDIVLRLLVNLTNPALLVFNEVIPSDKTDRNHYLEIVSHLQGYKDAFTSHKVWISITERLSKLLEEDVSDRDDEGQRSIERILILIRNVLHVPADVQNEFRPDNDASVHDQVIWALHQSGMLDLITYIASSSHEVTFYMHVLEIICLMVREQSASLLAQTVVHRSLEEKERDDKELLKIRQLELQKKQEKLRKYHGTRHSNFGGTFVVKNMKSISERDIIYHRPLHTVDHISLDLEKKKVKTPKNRMALKCENMERRSALSVRLILKQFSIEILNAAYNPLMRQVRELISRGKSQDNDESYYFNALRFFMEFNRSYKFQVKLVSETMSVEMFHLVQKYLEAWHELMVTDKKKLQLWSTRLHIALKAYKELLYNLLCMDQSSDEGVRESSRVIKSNIFYVIEYRELLLVLINSYKKTKYSDQYVKDLVETIHIFIKLLENFTKNKKIFVQKKIRNVSHHKKNSKKKEKTQPPSGEDGWTRLKPELDSVVQSELRMDVVPFDAASEKDMDQQKIDAMKQIQRLLKTGALSEAVAWLRASREVWPENNCFGSPEISPEDEVECLKEVYLTELPASELDLVEVAAGSSHDEDEEEEDIYPQLTEKTFDGNDFIKKFASPKVLCICNMLLKTFEENSVFINHAIAKMMHRIAWDCKLPSMLFQASLFRRFQQILKCNDVKYKELSKLARYIIQKFIEVAAVNKKVFVELLFWKSAKDAYEIENGYGSYKEKSKAAKVAWQEHEEDELRRLYVEFEQTRPSDDVVEWIGENIINKERSKRSVLKKLKELGLIVEKPKTQKKWTEEQEAEIMSLFNEFRESNDPVGDIKEKLSLQRSRVNITKTLLRLGLVQDKKELHKKKRKMHNKNGVSRNEYESESEESDEEYELSKTTVFRDVPKVDIHRAIQNLVIERAEHNYLCDGIDWLGSCFKEALEDVNEEEAEIPLLPLSEQAIKSVDNACFQQLMLGLGIYSPFEHQEMYWRFPATWKEDHLKCRLKLIEFLTENVRRDFSEFEDCLISLIRDIFGETVMLHDNRNSFRHSETSESESENEGDDETTRFNDIIARHCQQTINKELTCQTSKNNANGVINSGDKSKSKSSISSAKRRRASSGESNDSEPEVDSNPSSKRKSIKARISSDSEEGGDDNVSNTLHVSSTEDKDRVSIIGSNIYNEQHQKKYSEGQTSPLDNFNGSPVINVDKSHSKYSILSVEKGRTLSENSQSDEELPNSNKSTKHKSTKYKILSDSEDETDGNTSKVADIEGSDNLEEEASQKKHNYSSSDDETTSQFIVAPKKKRKVIESDEDD